MDNPNPSSPESASTPPIGSFEEASRFRLLQALSLTHLERLRDLEAMWDFNEMLERQNPKMREIAEKLRKG